MGATIVVNGRRMQCTDLADTQLHRMIADGLGWVTGTEPIRPPRVSRPTATRKAPRRPYGAKPSKSRRRY